MLHFHTRKEGTEVFAFNGCAKESGGGGCKGTFSEAQQEAPTRTGASPFKRGSKERSPNGRDPVSYGKKSHLSMRGRTLTQTVTAPSSAMPPTRRSASECLLFQMPEFKF